MVDIPIDVLPIEPAPAEGHAVGLNTANLMRRFETAPWVRQRIKSIKSTSGLSYTLLLLDEGLFMQHSHTAACTYNIPTNAAVPWPIGGRVQIMQVHASGKITFAPGSGVTLRVVGTKNKTAAQWAVVELIKVGTNEWVLTGETSA